MMGWQKDCGETPRCKEQDWQSFKQEDSTFYFVRNHFESIGKPILLKGGKVQLVNKMLIRAQVIVIKNTHKLFHKSLSKPIIKIGATKNFHSVPPIPKLRQTQAKPQPIGAADFHFGATEFSCQLSVQLFSSLDTTEFCQSVSPRFGPTSWLAIHKNQYH